MLTAVRRLFIIYISLHHRSTLETRSINVCGKVMHLLTDRRTSTNLVPVLSINFHTLVQPIRVIIHGYSLANYISDVKTDIATSYRPHFVNLYGSQAEPTRTLTYSITDV